MAVSNTEINYHKFFFFSKENLENAYRLAEIFHKSGCFSKQVQNAQQALIIIIAGAELGLQPIEAMNCFYFLNGALRLYGFGLSKILSRAGVSYTFHTLNKKEVDVSYYKNGQLLQRLKYTIEDLKQLRGNVQGLNILDKYPEEKLVYHAHSRFLRYYDVGGTIPLTDYDQEIIDNSETEETKFVETDSDLVEKKLSKPENEEKPKQENTTEEVNLEEKKLVNNLI